MRIAIASDHGGWELFQKLLKFLTEQGYAVDNLSDRALDPQDDYPDIALPVADAVSTKKADRGILICGSGVGVSVVANKLKGVRAALCHDPYSSAQGVWHDDMNVLCLGGQIIGFELAKIVVANFLEARFDPQERFKRRLDKVNAVENEH